MRAWGPPRSAFWDSWWVLAVKHALLICACVWAFAVQLTYRVPGGFLVPLLPWIGIALGALSTVLLLRALLAWISADPSFRSTLRWIDWSATLAAVGFVVYGAVLDVNSRVSASPPVERASVVVAMGSETVDLGEAIPVRWAELQGWEGSRRPRRVVVTWAEARRLWVGQPVRVRLRRGALGIPWVVAIDRDDEEDYKRVVEAVPTAAGAWKGLILLYLDRGRWAEAARATRAYLAVYPKDLNFALSVTGALGLVEHPAEVLDLIEPFLAGSPNYHVYTTAGAALSRVKQAERGIALLEAAIRLDPANPEAYHFLGFVYASMGRFAEAAPMFERALERRPGDLDLEAEVRSARPRLAERQAGREPSRP